MKLHICKHADVEFVSHIICQFADPIFKSLDCVVLIRGAEGDAGTVDHTFGVTGVLNILVSWNTIDWTGDQTFARAAQAAAGARTYLSIVCRTGLSDMTARFEKENSQLRNNILHINISNPVISAKSCLVCTY